jgi:mono/diheme cytochrome c family protein
MPDFRFDDRAVEAVVNAIYANGQARTARAGRAQEIPVKVHFAGKAGTTAGPPFTVHCGRCHRALTGRGAGMGEGAVGPNLSALFTPLHPGRPTPTSRWSPETLSRWVANPRSIRRAALMPPVAISAADLEALVESLRIPTANATGARSARLKPLSGNGIIGR